MPPKKLPKLKTYIKAEENSHFFGKNLNSQSAKKDRKNDYYNNNNNYTTDKFKDPSGERSRPCTFSGSANKRGLPQAWKKIP